MTTKPTMISPTRRHRRRWLWWIAVPLVAMVVLLIAGLWQERQASRFIEGELTRVRSAGLPYDDESMARWYADNTHREGTAAWSEILRLVESPTFMISDFDRLPIVSVGELPTPLLPGSSWPDEPFVAEFLGTMRPVIQRIDAARSLPTPVWMPIEFEGVATLLPEVQSSRSILRLLNLELTHALYHQDSDRALRALVCMRATADAFAMNLFMVGELMTIALHGVLHGEIGRSLEGELWSAEELVRLDDLLEPRDLRSRWLSAIAGERAMALSGTDLANVGGLDQIGGIGPLLRLPSVQAPLLDGYRQVERLVDDPNHLRVRSQKLETTLRNGQNRLSLGKTTQLFLLPAFSGFARAIESNEDSRRMTRTALAVKRFQLEYGRWPRPLSELAQVGFSETQWHTVSRGPLGWEIEDDVFYLWSYDLSNQYDVGPERPDEEMDSKVYVPTIRIR